jgi:hypothetical protein
MWDCLHVKYPLFLSDFNETWIFSTDVRRKLKHQVLSKSVQWEPSYFMRTDGRTGMTKQIVAFRNSANAPNKKNEMLKRPYTMLFVSIILRVTGHVIKWFLEMSQVLCSITHSSLIYQTLETPLITVATSSSKRIETGVGQTLLHALHLNCGRLKRNHWPYWDRALTDIRTRQMFTTLSDTTGTTPQDSGSFINFNLF